MTSIVKVANIAYPGSANTALTINANDSVSIGGGVISPQTGFKNRIINGGMTIDQRNAGASVTANNQYTIDRWLAAASQTSKYTVQQNAGAVTPPAGFINYLGVTSSSAYSVLTADNFFLLQPIEGLNVADLGWGTANAQTVIVSFLVRSSLTGTFGGALVNSAGNRSYPFSYSIAAANTWTTIAVTVLGDTTGTWLTTNGTGINVRFGLGSGSSFTATANVWGATNAIQPTGSVSVVGTSGATFYITGVQLERGTVASAFEFRSIGQELALCQRYLPMIQGIVIQAHVNNSKTDGFICVKLPTTPRTPPTGITVESVASWRFNNPSNNWPISTITYGGSAGTGDYVSVAFTLATSGVTEQEGTLTTGGGTAYRLGFTGCEL